MQESSEIRQTNLPYMRKYYVSIAQQKCQNIIIYVTELIHMKFYFGS